MHSYYISAATGGYYEGDRAHHLDVEVPQRPHQSSIWNGDSWSFDKAAHDHAQKLVEYEAAVDAHILAQANAMGYRSVESCISYIGDDNAKWDAEATRMKKWRSQCYVKCHELLNAGDDPGSSQALIALLPAFEEGS